MYLCQYFSDVLPLMYVFPYYYSALMALHTVLHVDTVLVAVALMIMTSLGPSPGLGRHIWSLCKRLRKFELPDQTGRPKRNQGQSNKRETLATETKSSTSSQPA